MKCEEKSDKTHSNSKVKQSAAKANIAPSALPARATSVEVIAAKVVCSLKFSGVLSL